MKQMKASLRTIVWAPGWQEEVYNGNYGDGTLYTNLE